MTLLDWNNRLCSTYGLPLQDELEWEAMVDRSGDWRGKTP